ncbi:MAG: hypothetical protein WCD81_03010 [Candidatus Bathyarchaeia archaeon]
MVDDRKNVANEKSVNKFLLEFHPQFLKAIRDVYPLGVLSSLSMTIAAFITSFAKESLALAQTYAIAASLMFLAAFSISLILKLFLALEKNDESPSLGLYALISYICTGSGIVFLFLTITQFWSVLSVARVIIPVFAILVIGVFLLPLPNILNTAKTFNRKSVLVLGYVSVVCYFLIVFCILIGILALYGIVLPFSALWVYLLAGSLFLGLFCVLVILVLGIIRLFRRNRQSPTEK